MDIQNQDFEKCYRRRRLKESGLFFSGLTMLSGAWFVGNKYIKWGWQGNILMGFVAATYTIDYMIFGLRI